MTAPELLLIAVLAIPLAQAALCWIAPRPAAIAESVALICALALAAGVIGLIALYSDAGRATVIFARPLPGAELAFRIEPLGLGFAALTAGLNLAVTIYTVGYGRMTGDGADKLALTVLGLVMATVIGAAFAANLFAFFLCFVALTLASFALHGQARDREQAGRAGQLHLGLLLAAELGLLLPAVVWTYALAGDLSFGGGGALLAKAERPAADILLVLFVLGFAKAGAAPLHAWMTASARAHPPAAAVLQASAVAITGAFGLIKVMIFVFGPGLGQAGQTGLVLAALALAGAIVAALVALSRPLLADRFAYTSVAHLGMIAAAALIATPAAWLAAALLLAGHACAKLAMILAAGSVELATGRTEVGELDGLGRRMPWTFLAFSAGALSLAALPPFAGAWGALWLVAGAAEIGALWAAAAVIAISALIFAALAAPAARAIFGQPPAHPFTRPDGVSALLVATAAVVGLASAALTMALDPIQRFLMLGPGAGGAG